MICLIQLLLCLGLVSIAFAVLVGQLKPGEALQRIGAILLLLLLGPAVIALLVKGVVVPAVSAAWSVTKHHLIVAAWILALVLIAWLVAGLFELYRNRNSGENQVHSREE